MDIYSFIDNFTLCVLLGKHSTSPGGRPYPSRSVSSGICVTGLRHQSPEKRGGMLAKAKRCLALYDSQSEAYTREGWAGT